MKPFIPTHTLFYPTHSPLNQMFPKGVPVVEGVTEDGYITWIADSEGNIGGYTQDTDDVNSLSYVVPIKD